MIQKYFPNINVHINLPPQIKDALSKPTAGAVPMQTHYCTEPLRLKPVAILWLDMGLQLPDHFLIMIRPPWRL